MYILNFQRESKTQNKKRKKKTFGVMLSFSPNSKLIELLVTKICIYNLIGLSWIVAQNYAKPSKSFIYSACSFSHLRFCCLFFLDQKRKKKKLIETKKTSSGTDQNLPWKNTISANSFYLSSPFYILIFSSAIEALHFC